MWRGKTITAVRVHHPRAVRRHEAGPADLTARLLNTRVTGTGRRGKYLWLTLDDESALVVHLGMSGQMLLGHVPNEGHLRIATLLEASRRRAAASSINGRSAAGCSPTWSPSTAPTCGCPCRAPGPRPA